MSEKNLTELSFAWKDGGFVTLFRKKTKSAWVLHIIPDEEHQVWGKSDGWFDGPIKTLGLGPLFALVWTARG